MELGQLTLSLRTSQKNILRVPKKYPGCVKRIPRKCQSNIRGKFSPKVEKYEDRFRDSKDKWPAHVKLEYFQGRSPLVELTPIPIVVMFLALPSRFPLENGGRVGFFDGRYHEKCCSADNQDDPVSPPPAQVLVYETPDDSYGVSRLVTLL